MDTGVIFVCSWFSLISMDAFSTYLCADSFSCFTGLMGLLFKWKCLKLLGIDRLKAHISVQVIVTTIIAHL